MDLIYMHIHNMERIGAKNIDLNFDPRYKCSFENGRIIINETKKELIKNFYGTKINNLSLIVGENGVGKSTILDKIGLDRNGLLSYQDDNDSFFMVYKSNLTIENEERYVIECFNCDDVISKLPPDDFRGDKHKTVSSFNAVRRENYICPKSLYDLSNDNTENITYYYRNEDLDFGAFLEGRRNIEGDRGTHWFKREPMSVYWEGLFEMCNSESIRQLDNFKEKKFIFVFKYSPFFQDGFEKIVYEEQLIKNISFYLQFASNAIEKYIIKYLYNSFMYSFFSNYADSYLNEGRLNFRFSKKYESEILSKIEAINEHSTIESYFEVKKYLLKMLMSVTFVDSGLEIALGFFEKMERIKITGMNNELDSFIISENIQENKAFLKFYDSLKNQNYSLGSIIYSSLKCHIEKMSSGEMQLLALMSRIYTALKKHIIDGKYTFDKKVESVTLVFDEPEEKLHPNWNRQLLKYIVDAVELYGRDDVKYNVIITTHSPFLVSDVLKENILCLKRNENGNVEVVKSNFGFLSNISELYENSFFMEYNVGEFSLKKLRTFMQNIEQLSMNEANSFIDSIGDELVRKNLMNMYMEKNKEYKIFVKKQEIERLKQEIKLLEVVVKQND